MKAIVTSFAADERHRPGIAAECMGKSTRIPYDTELSLDDNHVRAARKLAESLGWVFDWVFGLLPSGDYCHVAVVDIKQYTTRTTGTKSPPESWRGRGSGSTARRVWS